LGVQVPRGALSTMNARRSQFPGMAGVLANYLVLGAVSLT
jgi:hypothetical protein